MVGHLQLRVTPWRQYASHVKVRGTLSKMDVLEINHIVFKKPTNTIVPNEWLCQIPSRSDVAAKVDYIIHNLNK